MMSRHSHEIESMYDEFDRKSKYLGFAVISVTILISLVYNGYAVAIARLVDRFDIKNNEEFY